MTIEFEIDEMRKVLSTSLGKSTSEAILDQEFRRIVEKHRKAAVEECSNLIKSFTVHVLTEPSSGITKVKITMPDVP